MSQHGQKMKMPNAFTLVELIIVLSIVALCVGLATAWLVQAQREAKLRNVSSRLRGIHQSMVIFSANNGGWFAGVDSNGAVIPDGRLTGSSGTGATVAARSWIMVNGGFVPSEFYIHPLDDKVAWKSGAMTLSNVSYAMLRIADPKADAGRLAEWRETMNSQAVLICDRNIGKGIADADTRSYYDKQAGPWKGQVIWGDNHWEFIQSNFGFQSRYQKTVGSCDSLFTDGPSAPGSGITESGTKVGSNAMMVWE